MQKREMHRKQWLYLEPEYVVALINSLCGAPGGGFGTTTGLFSPATETSEKRKEHACCVCSETQLRR